ncbi:hypothetical protein [Stakelama tenebrarum]|uniref:Uncharacterized protein n=1 Tax=Stakelama tenebrarum TaxID=2711215 RepID=A0A6G6Y4B0_9SPHN|nr:hypothetical protein [Sphingosinithalassobacter tenebrarum]QIG79681.1 hypothetical protein G5C33_07670 [Sphingosinithalassobacter tenebrarum]
MGLRSLRTVSENNAETTEYRITVTLDVVDVQALWNAAAERALQAPGMTLADVLDTIGPREDPSIADCLAMLAVPTAIPGCTLDDARIRSSEEAGAEPIALPRLPAITPLRSCPIPVHA